MGSPPGGSRGRHCQRQAAAAAGSLIQRTGHSQRIPHPSGLQPIAIWIREESRGDGEKVPGQCCDKGRVFNVLFTFINAGIMRVKDIDKVPDLMEHSLETLSLFFFFPLFIFYLKYS